MIWVKVSKEEKNVDGWVGWALSKFISDFWNLFNFGKPLGATMTIAQ